jgi:phosphatidylserine synthase
MTLAEKIVGGVVGIALVTTLVLNDHQTASVISAFFDGFSGAVARAMGR